MLEFFKLTEEDLKKAVTGNDVNFKDGEEATFTMTKLIEDKEKGYMRLETLVNSGENMGKTYSFFFRANAYGARDYVQLLLAFASAQDILQKKVGIQQLIGKKFNAKAKLSTKDGVTYTNFRNYKKADATPDVPDHGEQSVPVI